MKAFIDETGEWIKHGPNIIANNTRYIVNDFTTEPDYQNRSYVVGCRSHSNHGEAARN
jgi:hypothetical protein